MRDAQGRPIHYLRISVTDRCNLRCRYCRPAEGVELHDRGEVLRLEEFAEVVRVAAGMGVDKVRLTGGEPLLRRGVVELVRWIRAVPGIAELTLTTNGILLPDMASSLKEAGLDRVNVSLDTLDPARFRELTRGGEVADVLAGIEAALAAGLAPVKLNCVIRESSAEPDAVAVREWGQAHGCVVRFIRQMDLAVGQFWQVEGGDGGDCVHCGRLRLTSRGDLVPCLFSDLRFNIREHGIARALELAVANKPISGCHSRENRFYTIGG